MVKSADGWIVNKLVYRGKSVYKYLYLSTWCGASESHILKVELYYFSPRLTVFRCLDLVRFHSSVISHLCVESLQSIVSVLSQVESDGEVGANPTSAAAASASGINPVSRDGYCCFSFFNSNVQGICRS